MLLNFFRLQWFKHKVSYTPIPSVDQENEAPGKGRTRTQTFLIRTNFVLTSIILILSSLLVALAVSQHSGSGVHGQSGWWQHLHSPGIQEHFLEKRPWNYSSPSPCGLSPDSARKVGCKWSAMTFAWYPPACFDAELNDKFFALQDWKYYSTEDLNEDHELPRDAIIRGDIPKAYMTMDYHRIHCMYTVRKLYRALMGFSLSDNYILTLGHLDHCERFVLRKDEVAVKGR